MIIHKALMLYGSNSRVGSGAMLASGRGGGTSDRSGTGAAGRALEPLILESCSGWLP